MIIFVLNIYYSAIYLNMVKMVDFTLYFSPEF